MMDDLETDAEWKEYEEYHQNNGMEVFRGLMWALVIMASISLVVYAFWRSA